MKDVINQWFEQSVPFEGIQACCLRHPDQSFTSKSWASWADGNEEAALDGALKCVGDIQHVLQMNKIPPARLRWVYEHALLHCERRGDGACLGVFTLRDEQSFDRHGLERMFTEFQTLSAEGGF
jgi:hypothetical protein